MKILLLKRRNIGMNIEMYFTYVNLGLLFHFLCNLAILYGFAAHCLFVLFSYIIGTLATRTLTSRTSKIATGR